VENAEGLALALRPANDPSAVVAAENAEEDGKEPRRALRPEVVRALDPLPRDPAAVDEAEDLDGLELRLLLDPLELVRDVDERVIRLPDTQPVLRLGLLH